MLIRSKKEKEELIIKLANEGKTTREIAEEAHVSLKTIGQILNKVTGDDEDEKKERLKDKSDYAKAFQMFRDGRPLTDVAIDRDAAFLLQGCFRYFWRHPSYFILVWLALSDDIKRA